MSKNVLIRNFFLKTNKQGVLISSGGSEKFQKINKRPPSITYPRIQFAIARNANFKFHWRDQQAFKSLAHLILSNQCVERSECFITCVCVQFSLLSILCGQTRDLFNLLMGRILSSFCLIPLHCQSSSGFYEQSYCAWFHTGP